VVVTNEKWYKSVDYSRLVWPLIEAIKEQQIQAKKQQIQIEELQKEIKLLQK